MLSESSLGMTFQVLHQSKQTFRGASQRTWVQPQGLRVLLTRTSPLLAPTLSTTTVQKTDVPFVSPNKRQKNRLIHRQLEENNLRPRHPQYCFRLQNSVALQTSSVFSTSYKPQPSKCSPYKFRGGEPPHQGGHCRNTPHKRGFLQSFVPSPQKGWNFSTCDRLEFPEQVCGKLTLPDGKHSLPKVSTSKGRLYDHSGSERCLSVSPSPQGLTKVSSIPLERQMLRLPRPLFWLKYCTKDLHQTFKTRSSIPSPTGCSYDTLSGRLPNLGVNLPGGAESHSSGCIPPGKPRLRYQSGKVTSNPNPNNNIPGFCNRLHCRNTKPPTGESCKGEIPLYEGIRNSNYVCSSSSKFTRHSRVVSPSNLASPPSFPILADQNDPSSARTRQVEHHCRLRVEGVQRQQRVEDRPSNDFPISEGVQNRPVCLSPIHPTSPVRQLASGSRGTACGCVDNGLGTLQGLRLSTLQSDSSRPKQTVSGQSRHHTDITSSTMVATTTEPPGRATCPPPELQTPPEGPSRPSEDSSNVPQTTLIVQLM